MSLKLFLDKLSSQVYAETSVIKASFENSTNKGSGFEIVIRNLLLNYSQGTNLITHGEIIDSFGNKSGQVDVAIAQNSHPRGYNDGRPNIVLYDLVTAIGEVKMSLNTAHLDSTIKNSNDVSTFKRHGDNNNILSNIYYGDDQKPPPYYLIAYSSNIAYKTLADNIENSKITLAICLKHETSEKGVIVLGKTHSSSDIITLCNNLGKKLEDNLWEVDNPVLALIWALYEFNVPMQNLTPMIPCYF
ncbi:MAG TPA: DUF6602 domain-containing protein [Segetibacter sp.]|jgi:hypothetical protein